MADVKTFTRTCVPESPPLQLSLLPTAPYQPRPSSPPRCKRIAPQMFSSLQNVLPSSVLSSISNNQTTKNQPEKGADDIPDRDNFPSSPKNRAMTVDEQGVKKKKGRSNEVSSPSSYRKRHNHECALFPTPALAFSSPLVFRRSTAQAPRSRISDFSLPTGVYRRSPTSLKVEPPSQPSSPTRTTKLS